MKLHILGMNRGETIGVFVIVATLLAVTTMNMQTAQRRARDAQRKSDIRSVYDALLVYQDEFGSFPASSSDGRIMACSGEFDDKGVYQFTPCEWYYDGLLDVFDETYKPYLERIPSDPHHGRGARYYYISNQKNFQLYASLEGEDEDEFSEAIAGRNLACGNRTCNFGRANGKVPLDKSLSEYENEMRRLEESQ